MKSLDLNVSRSDFSFPLNGFYFPDFISPSVCKSDASQTHYFFSPARKTASTFRLNPDGVELSCQSSFDEPGNARAFNDEKFPYGQTGNQWRQYSLAPHSYLPLNQDHVQIGLNFFNRFLHVDFNTPSARFIDPGIGDEMLSTTNWFDRVKDELWFASWPVEGTVRRIDDPGEESTVRIWKLSLRKNDVERMWEGDFADSLHQVSLSPDGRFLILTELGLHFQQKNKGGGDIRRREANNTLIPSKTLFLNVMSGRTWRWHIPTAGHIEFDPRDHTLCYLSSHNIGLAGNRVSIAGPGIIKKIRLGEDGPVPAGEFTHPDFYRITTHIVFSHRGRTIIGVTGYPDKVFLIDASSMTLFKIMELDQGEKVDCAAATHVCRQDSYGIAASEDGESLLVAGTGFIRAGRVDEGIFSFEQKIPCYGLNDCFTGHVGVLAVPGA